MEKKYDLRKLIQRTYDNIPCDSKQEKAAVTVRIFDVEKEINLSELGTYRKADIVSLIENAFENRDKRMLAKVPDNLEGIVAQNPMEPSKGKVVYEMVKGYAKNNILKLPRYALFGALPAKIQEKLGERYNENPLNYTTANIVAESVANAGLIAYWAHTINFNEMPDLSCNGFLVFCFYSGFNLLLRSHIALGFKGTNGNWFIGVLRGLYDSVDYTLFALKNKYLAKKEELKKEREQLIMKHKAEITQIETKEAKQLPSPESSALQKVK